MDKHVKREVVATLVRQGRRDLALVVAQGNPYGPLFRGLASVLRSASDSGQSDVIRAKRAVGYTHEDLAHLERGATSAAQSRDHKLAYDAYYRIIVQSEDRVVKTLTNKPRAWWLKFERRVEA